MKSLLSLSRAIFLAFRRDKAAVFFTIGFPLMFLVLFGGIFKSAGAPKVNVLEVGPVPVVDTLPADARTQIDDILKFTQATDIAAAQDKVRKGDYDAAIAQDGSTVTVYYSAADQVKSATVQAIMDRLVQEFARGEPTGKTCGRS